MSDKHKEPDRAKKPKRSRGRPPKAMPEPIEATLEEIADVVMRQPLPTEWRYLKPKK